MTEENTQPEKITNDSPDTMLNLNGDSSEPAQELSEESSQDEAPEENKSEEDYLYAGKFKGVDDLEKGYKELVKKLTEKRPEAPEEYKFNFKENETLKNADINLDDDPTYQSMLPVFKELNLSQEQAELLVSKYLETSYEQLPDIGSEMEKLGPKGQETISRIEKYVASNFSEEEASIAQQIGSTAEGIKFLEKRVLSKHGETPIPTDAGKISPAKSSQELMAEAVAYRKENQNFDMDKKAQARYEKLMDEAVKLQVQGK